MEREPLTEYKKGDQPARAQRREPSAHSSSSPQSQNWNLSPEAVRTLQLFPVLVMQLSSAVNRIFGVLFDSRLCLFSVVVAYSLYE